MNCGNCGAAMRLVRDEDYFVCDFCTSFHFPEPSVDGVRSHEEETPVNCPVCRVSLSYGSVERCRVLHCKNCLGVLANQGSFGLIVRLLRTGIGSPLSAPPRHRVEDADRRLACPYCSEEMDQHPYYGPGEVFIDTCPSCAILWLDHGEIARIRIAHGPD